MTQDNHKPKRRLVELDINGDLYEVAVAPHDTLNSVLREQLGLTGTKRGCDTGGCGTCTVLVDGQAVYSCMYPSIRAAGRRIRTIEGVADHDKLHPIQEALVEGGGVQCGYCTPGVVLATMAIYAENPRAGAAELREELAGNLCRCTGYVKMIEALASAGPRMGEIHG